MSNRERAAEIVTEFLDGNVFAANIVTKRLADAGLLAPDLPEPSRESIEGYHTAHPWAEWDVDAAAIMALNDGRVVFQDADEWESCIYMNPDAARAAAYKLLAAANAAEGNQK